MYILTALYKHFWKSVFGKTLFRNFRKFAPELILPISRAKIHFNGTFKNYVN